MSRVFMYNGISLEDPDPEASLDEVRYIYAGIYSDIINAEISGPKVEKSGDEVYTFRKVVGTKGSYSEDDLRIMNSTMFITIYLYEALLDDQSDLVLPPPEALGLI